MTEEKIREAYEKKSGTPFKNMDAYQELEYCYFRAGYLALLNSLQFTTPELYRLPEGVTRD